MNKLSHLGSLGILINIKSGPVRKGRVKYMLGRIQNRIDVRIGLTAGQIHKIIVLRS